MFAFSGILEGASGGRGSFALVAHALSLAGGRRVCYIPTAVGDSAEAVAVQQSRFTAFPDVELSVLRYFPQPSFPDVRLHLLAQDLLLVEGGSVVNLMAVWRAHGLPGILRECWESGVVLAGASAGSLCWHLGGPTDSFRDGLDPFADGLGLLPYSNGVHDDFIGQPRREAYRRMVASGELTAGNATEDGVGLHYIGTRLHEAVSIRPGARAWRVEPDGAGGWAETAIAPREI